MIRSQGRRAAAKSRVLDARPDTLDFRDRMFEPTLIEVQTERPLDEYRKMRVPILDQGTEGACTGFGLATVVHYLLRTRDVIRDDEEVSPRMLYDMARRYDEWPGEKYSGSSARGAMKGWHKHGVCSRPHWIYDLNREKQDNKLYAKRFDDALRRPLGAYFRVNHKDLIAMHAAITEVGILYATSQVHEGWQNVGSDGVINWSPEAQIVGGHAFAIVAYDANGFWIQNSWADDWGKDGFAQVSYDDWLANGSDIWVARLGAPVVLRSRESVSRSVGVASQGSRSYVFCDLRPHIISLGNNGALKTDGTYGTSEEDVKEIFSQLSSRIEASDIDSDQAPDALRARRPHRRGLGHPESRGPAAHAARCRCLPDLLHLADRSVDDDSQHPAGFDHTPAARGIPRQRERLHARPAGRRPRAGREERRR